MGIFTLGPLIGPVVGPVAGGFIAQHLSYHWIFWIIAILAGAASALGIPILRETYAPVILRRRAKKLGKEVKSPHSLGEILWINLTRPITLLTRSFICFIFSLYMAVVGVYLDPCSGYHPEFCFILSDLRYHVPPIRYLPSSVWRSLWLESRRRRSCMYSSHSA